MAAMMCLFACVCVCVVCSASSPKVTERVMQILLFWGVLGRNKDAVEKALEAGVCSEGGEGY